MRKIVREKKKEENSTWLCDYCGARYGSPRECQRHEDNCSHKSKSSGGLLSFFIILVIFGLIFFGWGFIGGAISSSAEITCDMGIEDTLCWIWHKNIFGQFKEGVNDLFGG